MKSRLIQALLEPHRYSHRVSDIRLIETHISWVILTGQFVYKIKKPVDLGFLDFSTLSKRKFYCEEEIRLNRRFSDEIYIEVVTITGSKTDPQINGDGNILEYAVKMLEFDQSCLMDTMLENGLINEDHIKKLAKILAHSHKHKAADLASQKTTNDFGSVMAVVSSVMENFEQIRPLVNERAALKQLTRLYNWVITESENLRQLFTIRRSAGFIKECHGDLHLGNIAIIEGEVTFFDCLEFNARLRWIDTISELAFLLMDLENKAKPDLANCLLNSYLEYSGDYDGLRLLDYYKVYRAMVRAKVDILRVSQHDLSAESKEKVYANFKHYLNLAEADTKPGKVFLAITHGVSGTGKSTKSALIAGSMNAIRIRSDVERKRLFGLAPDQKSHSELDSKIYSKEASDNTFTRLREITAKLLAWKYPVIVDASFLDRKRRYYFSSLAIETEVPFVILDCRADNQLILQRLKKRAKSTQSVSEAGIEVMRKQIQTQDILTDQELKYTLRIETIDKFKPGELLKLIKITDRKG